MKLPEPIWAVALAFMGVCLAVACLFHPGPQLIGTAVLAIASNLVSGALGAFAGHAGSTSNVTDPNSTINASAGSVDAAAPITSPKENTAP
jgi:membrane associated rhomboid family serine protease